jgi:hypothetical protein
LTCVFELQASTQAVDSGEIRPGSSCSAQGPTEGGGNEGGNEGGGGSEIESGGTEDDIDEDGASLDASQTGSAEKGKKRKRKQNPAGNLVNNAKPIPNPAKIKEIMIKYLFFCQLPSCDNPHNIEPAEILIAIPIRVL